MFKNKLHFNKIYMSCKRGMLELDIILLKFLEEKYFDLDLDTLFIFELLLAESDKNLYNWLIKGDFCTNELFVDLINYIRCVAYTYNINN